jgi:alkylhydroperoxidase/carboxymuconolactone decarboxylase family protein YurZ
VDKSSTVSNAFKVFWTEASAHAQAWGNLVQDLGKANCLDQKTSTLGYLAVLAALNRTSGIPFHVISAKEAGATRDEIISAILLGLPAAGHVVTQALPVALETYDQA